MTTMHSHGTSPIYVWLSGSARSRVEAIARKENVPAAHVAGRLLAQGVGVPWTEDGRPHVGFRPLRATNPRRPNSVYVTASPGVLARIRTGARVNGMTVSRFASSRIYASLGIRFVAPTMGKVPRQRSQMEFELARQLNARRAHDHYHANRDRINAARRVSALTPEQRDEKNRKARVWAAMRRERRRAERAEEEAFFIRPVGW